MPVYKKAGRTFYSYDFRYRGQRFSGNTGCETKRDAKRFEDAERTRLKAATNDLTKPINFMTASSLYWDQVGQFLVNRDDCERALAWLQGQIGNPTLVKAISDADVAKAVARRRGEGVSPSTVNRSVTEPLRAILRRARRVWKQTVQDIDWKMHLLPEPEERVREATGEEEKSALNRTRPDYWPAIRFAFLTGCRRAEIVGLQWTAVDFFNNQFTVTGKRGRSRKIPMTAAVRSLLWSLKDQHPTSVFTYVVRRPRGEHRKGDRAPITMEGFKTEWRRHGKKGVSNFRFHDTRHTAASRLVRATGNLKLAQKLLGHTELATTSRYSHVTDGDLRAGLEAMVHTEINTPDVPEAAKVVKSK